MSEMENDLRFNPNRPRPEKGVIRKKDGEQETPTSPGLDDDSEYVDMEDPRHRGLGSSHGDD